MAASLVVHFSINKSTCPALQDDRPIPESAETMDRNQKVRKLGYDHINSLIKPLLSGSISVLCLLIVLCGCGFLYCHGIHESLDAGPLPPMVRLDRAIVVGRNQGQAETFRGIPYARPP